MEKCTLLENFKEDYETKPHIKTHVLILTKFYELKFKLLKLIYENTVLKTCDSPQKSRPSLTNQQNIKSS